MGAWLLLSQHISCAWELKDAPTQTRPSPGVELGHEERCVPLEFAWIRSSIVPGSGWLCSRGVWRPPVNSSLWAPPHIPGQEALPALGTFLPSHLSPGLMRAGGGETRAGSWGENTPVLFLC